MKRALLSLSLLFVLGCTSTMQVGDPVRDPITGVERPATAADVVGNLTRQIEELEAAQDATNTAIPWTGPAAGLTLVAAGFLGTKAARLKKERALLIAHIAAKGITLPDGIA